MIRQLKTNVQNYLNKHKGKKAQNYILHTKMLKCYDLSLNITISVSLRPQLSTVIIPLACTVLVVLIIACAVVVHMRRHPHLDVETADFDFTDECTAVSTETSWEVMRRSLIRLLCHCYASDSGTGTATANYGTVLVCI